jgi:hypothetical protein
MTRYYNNTDSLVHTLIPADYVIISYDCILDEVLAVSNSYWFLLVDYFYGKVICTNEPTVY